MQKSQLINILNTFSKKEIRDCRKWLESPYHNQREDCILLFNYLCEHLREEEALAKERVYRRIFSKAPFDDARMRQTMHFLLKVIEDFLSYEAFSKDTIQSKITLAQLYRKRSLDTLYHKTLKSAQKVHESLPHRDEAFFQKELAILREKYEYLEESQQRSASMNLQEISDTLDRTFITSKLKQACMMIAHQKVYKVEYEIGILSRILDYVVKNNLLEIPAISIYFYIYKISEADTDEEAFEKVKQLAAKYAYLFPNAEATDIYLMAVNYCIRQINKGKKDFIPEMFQLYKEGIERKIFIVDGTIDRFLFRNIVTAGAYLGEFDWLEEFTREYAPYLDPRHRDDYVNLSMSVIFSGKKEYEKAMKLLVQYDFKDTLINLNGKAMLIKMYYELKEISALESLLDSATIFVKRKKDLTNNYKLLYNNLIKYTKKLLRVNPYDKAKKEKLRQEIMAANPLIEKRWFLEQLEKI